MTTGRFVRYYSRMKTDETITLYNITPEELEHKHYADISFMIDSVGDKTVTIFHPNIDKIKNLIHCVYILQSNLYETEEYKVIYELGNCYRIHKSRFIGFKTHSDLVKFKLLSD